MGLLINILAAVALALLWSSEHGRLWWGIFGLLAMHLFVSQIFDKAKNIGSKDFVVRFWGRVTVVLSALCFASSCAGIIVAFR